MGDYSVPPIAVFSGLRSGSGATVVHGRSARAAVGHLSGSPAAAPTAASSSGLSTGCGQSRESSNRHHQWAAADPWKNPGESSDD